METEIKLMNVARASLDELLADYEDFLRVRGFPVWEKDSRESLFVRKKGEDKCLARDYFLELARTRPPEVVANMAICLIFQAKYLLMRQLRFLEGKFLREGGMRERMSRMRRDRGFVPNIFLGYLSSRGVDEKSIKKLCIDNPANLLA